MFKKIIAAFAALLAATAFAAVDANKASQAELESVKGIGPVISTLIVSERKKGEFKDWNDLVTRVKGVGDKSAGKFSEAGLTVNGATFTGVPMAAPAKAAKADKSEKVGKAPVATQTAASATMPAKAASTSMPAKPASASKAETKAETKAEKRAERAEARAAKAASAASAPAKK